MAAGAAADREDGVDSRRRRFAVTTEFNGGPRARVKIRNTYPKTSGATITGSCTFYFKDPESEEPIPKPKVVRNNTPTPNGEILEFAAPEGSCVSSYRVRITVRIGGRDDKLDPIEEPDEKGKCLLSASYDCGQP